MCFTQYFKVAITAAFAAAAVFTVSLLSLPVASANAGSAVVGCWKVKIDLPWPISDKTARACFELESGKLIGRMRMEDKWKPLSNISFDGARLVFTGDGPRGKARFDGRLRDNDRIEGKVKVGDRTRPFRAGRLPGQRQAVGP